MTAVRPPPAHSLCRGQDISSRQSHKSYRPLTILVFRAVRLAWARLAALAPPGLQQQVLLPRPPPVLQHAAGAQARDDADSSKHRPPGQC